MCVPKVRHRIHHLPHNTSLIFLGLNLSFPPLSLSLSTFINLIILSPSLSRLILLFTCMRTAGLITIILLFHYIILHNDYHNKSWYNVYMCMYTYVYWM